MWKTLIGTLDGSHYPIFPGMIWEEVERYDGNIQQKSIRPPASEKQREAARELAFQRNRARRARTVGSVLESIRRLRRAYHEDIAADTGLSISSVKTSCRLLAERGCIKGTLVNVERWNKYLWELA